jgi:chromosome segregation ATPase
MDENLQSQIKAVKDDLDLAWTKIKEDSKNIESLTKSLNKLAELVNTFKNEYSDKIDNIDKTLEDLQTEIDDIKGNIKDLQAQVDENEERLAKVDAKLDETVNAILKGESSEEYTPDDENSKKLSEAEIEEFKTIAAALSNQKKSLKNEIASLEKRIEDLENELTTKLNAKADFEGYEINGLTSSKLSDILQELKDLIDNATTVEESFNVNDSETN